jgi:uncharacterized protein (AIM24 family)
MRKSLGIALIIMLALSVAGAWAGEIEGKIQSLDTSDRTIVLDNGTTLSVAEGVSMDMLRQGADVKVSYEERDGKNIATSVEVK